jgi:C6 transcription factor Pro1
VHTHGAEYCDMRNVMGCENAIVLALAEISHLGHWKEAERKHGRLSMPLLVKKGQEIEARLLMPPTRAHESYAGAYPGANAADRTAQVRQATSNIFRASAKVYLHSVLSGDQPACPEIRQAVQETVDCFQTMPQQGRREIVRMTVFCICICGCLTDDQKHRKYLLGLLEEQAVDRVGNCDEVKKVMKTVWERRQSHPHHTNVPWRDVMQTTLGGDKNRLLLLV